MADRMTILYVGANLCIFALLSLDPEKLRFLFMAVWIASSFLYPIIMAIAGRKTSFWSGLGMVMLILAVTQICGFALYAIRTHAIRHRDYMAAVLFASWLLGSVAVSAICYVPGYAASRWVKKPG